MTPQAFQVGDVVKAHVQVQSNAATGEVSKLSYRARGPFQIKECLIGDSYIVHPYHNPNGGQRKYKGSELYLLPPSIFPSEPLDCMDERYLNFSSAPIVSPLAKPLKIELYNNTFFPTNSKHITKPSYNHPIDTKAFLNHDPHPSIPASSTLSDHTSSNIVTKLPTQSSTPDNTSPIVPFTVPVTSHSTIASSLDKLFFINYTPEGTMQPRWYLIQIDMESTLTMNPSYKSDGIYWCVFLASHPNDSGKVDSDRRWWPEWHRYHRDPSSKEIIFDDRVLIRPNHTPSSDKFIQWACLLPIVSSSNCVLLGPFNFVPISQSNRVRQRVPISCWHHLHRLCIHHGLPPPSLSPSHSSLPSIPPPPKPPTKHKKSKRRCT